MFSERLMRARKAAGMSMNALGIAIGVSANAIKKYEHGETVDAPKSGPTKDVDFSRLKEALTIKDEKAIAKIIFTLIDDEELVQALIEDLENCLIELEKSEEEL